MIAMVKNRKFVTILVSKFTFNKQLQLEAIMKRYKCDIVHLQETYIEDSSFQHCAFIKGNFSILSNNNISGYGTASLVHNGLKIENERYDANGRVFLFDIDNTTFCNVYLEAGTNSLSSAARESYCGDVLPNLLINRCSSGSIRGDWYSIIDKRDATTASKVSPNLSRLSNVSDWEDSHRSLHPNNENCYDEVLL